jgi:ribosomal protein S18 acetylase RimI-like enzyme
METSERFRQEHVLDGGQVIVLRHIQPSDAPELRRAFRALSPETRYRRFFGAVTDLDDASLRYLTSVDGKDHVAIIATTDSLDLKTERGVGVARFVRSGNPHVAEAAVTVVDDMQRRGIGAHLTNALAQAARERGVDNFRCEVLESNDVVVHALREAGATIVEQGGGVVVLDVPLVSTFGGVGRALRIAAEHVNAFLRRLLPPSSRH